MESWEEEDDRLRLGAGLLAALLASVLLHAGLLIWARGFEVPGMSRSYFDAIVPRTFRIERAEIDPRLLDPEPDENRSQAMTPEPVALAEERPELGRLPGVEDAPASAPQLPGLKLSEKPSASAGFTLPMERPDGGALVEPSELAEVERMISADAGLDQPAAGSEAASASGTPLVAPGPLAGGSQPGFSNLDELLARTGPLSPETAPILLPTDLLFDYDSDALRPQAEESLSKLATLILRNPQSRFLIEGHTDSFGSEEYNLELSARRARTVRDWLERRMGIAPERLGARGLGKSRLIAPASGTIEEQQINRRVEIVVLAGGGEN